RGYLPILDAVFSYGGGEDVITAYRRLGARSCHLIYNGFDPEIHRPVAPDPRFAADLAFLGNRLPDREERVRLFLLKSAELAPSLRFLLGGAGWDTADLPANVKAI